MFLLKIMELCPRGLKAYCKLLMSFKIRENKDFFLKNQKIVGKFKCRFLPFQYSQEAFVGAICLIKH